MAPMDSDTLVAKKGEWLLPCSYHFYERPPVIVSGSGTKLRDSEGREYTDFFAGVSVMSCGHCNPAIIEPVIEQIRTLQHTTSIYLTEPVVRLAERLAGFLPGTLSKSFFCNSGSEAVEGAMLLARVATGRPGFIALEGSLHGRTWLTAAATGIPMWRTDPFLDGAPVRFARDAGDVLRILAERGDETAALLVEPIQGNAGVRPLPAGFFDEVLPALRKAGALLVADEVQTGFARTGRNFAIERWGVAPDILAGAKALGNGFPIGFFSTTAEIAARFTRPSASTLGGNPVSATAALAVLDFIEKEGLAARAETLGALLRGRLAEIAASFGGGESAPLGTPRGLGLMLGLPVRGTADIPAPRMTDLILEGMKDLGWLIGKNGLDRDVLAFQPPLIITKEEIDAMTRDLARVVTAVSQGVSVS